MYGHIKVRGEVFPHFMVDFTQQDYKCAMNMQSTKKLLQKTRSTKQTIILRGWRSFCHLFMIILILLVLNKAQNLLNLQQVRSSFCLACVMEEGLIGITDLTTPSITLIAKCGLIDGVNILPKIGNDDAYQKSRKMIYTPYSTSPHIHIPTVCNN